MSCQKSSPASAHEGSCSLCRVVARLQRAPACRVTSQHRSTQRKPSTRDPRTEVRQRMHEIVATRIRYGYRRVHVMLKREGWQVGRNVVYPLYREEGLVLREATPPQDGRASGSAV